MIVLIPTTAEMNALKKALRFLYPKESFDGTIDFFKTGTGKTAKVNLIHHYNRLNNNLLLLTGTAGALNSKLRAGDIIVPERVMNMQHESLHCHPEYDSLLTSYSCSASSTLLSAEQIVSTPDEKRNLHQQYTADVIDMESYDIVMTCKEYRLPLLIMKIIFDQENESLFKINNHYCLTESLLPVRSRQNKLNLQLWTQNYQDRLVRCGTILAKILHTICIQNRNMLKFSK